MHFAIDQNQDNRLIIKAGNFIDTLTTKVYKRDKEQGSQFEETVSYEIPEVKLKELLDNWYSHGSTMLLSNYSIIISDEIACSLNQLIKVKNK